MKLRSASVTVMGSLLMAIVVGTVNAETIAVDGQVALKESSVAKPNRGMTMETVEAQFGHPSNKRAAVGQPPITRWDYPGFSVFFEHQIVLHTVTTGSSG